MKKLGFEAREICMEISGMKTLLRVSVMFWKISSPVFKSLSWSCLVHLSLDAQPYRLSRMGLSLHRTVLLC